jgi:hypothetical protein
MPIHRKSTLGVLLALNVGVMVLPRAATAAFTWKLESTPVPSSSGFGHELNGIACPSTSTCVAAGWYQPSDGYDHALIERWGESGWSIEPTPAAGTAINPALDAVACSSASVCTAVGSYQHGTLVLRWDGLGWSRQTSPSPGQDGAELHAVSCPSARSCMAVGQAYQPPTPGAPMVPMTLAEAWDGNSWRVLTTPRLPGTYDSFLTGVSCTSATACMAVGWADPQGGANPSPLLVAERWDGTSWTAQKLSIPSGFWGGRLSAISCPAPTSCTAVGYYDDAGSFATLAERWSGTRWVAQRPPNPGGMGDARLYGVSCVKAGVCTAVGQYLDAKAGVMVTLAEHSGGLGWTKQATPNPAGTQSTALKAVVCQPTGTCAAIGAFNVVPSDPDFPLAERYA